MKWILFFALLVATQTTVSVAAVDSSPEGEAAASAALTRGIRLGLSYQGLLGTPFPGVSSSGPGLTFGYEYKIRRATSVDMVFSYRTYGGEPRLSQVGYGFQLRHALLVLGAPGFSPYLSYGLLFQVSRLGGHSGSGTSHDTALGAGTDFELFGAKLFASLHYHYSRLRYFDTSALNMDYWESGLGWRHEW